jgi:hypothetical protein
VPALAGYAYRTSNNFNVDISFKTKIIYRIMRLFGIEALVWG